MVGIILLFLIEILFFVIFSAFLYENLPAFLRHFGIANYIIYSIVDLFTFIIDCLLPIPFLILFHKYAFYCYFWWLLCAIILILFQFDI